MALYDMILLNDGYNYVGTLDTRVQFQTFAYPIHTLFKRDLTA